MIPEGFDISKIIPIIISIIALAVSILSFFWNVNIEFYKRKSNIEVWQRNRFFVGGEDERTEINLIMRNLSPRPSAILAISVRDEKGGIIKNLEGTENINLPIKIESWGVEKVTFRITPEDEARMEDIQVQDIDDEQIIVKRLNGNKWHK